MPRQAAGSAAVPAGGCGWWDMSPCRAGHLECNPAPRRAS